MNERDKTIQARTAGAQRRVERDGTIRTHGFNFKAATTKSANYIPRTKVP